MSLLALKIYCLKYTIIEINIDYCVLNFNCNERTNINNYYIK